MCCFRQCSDNILIFFVFSLLSGLAQADKGDYIVGLGLDGDTAAGRAISLFGDLGVSDNAWFSAATAYTQSAAVSEFDAVYADIALDYFFRPVGVRIGGAYWGDSELLNSVDFRGSAYYRNERFSLSANYERRDFDFTSQAALTDGERTVSFYASGVGFSGWLKTSKNTSLHIGGMDYDYSEDIRLQERIDVLRTLSVSRLSLMNSLVDYRLSAGFTMHIGKRSLDLDLRSWRRELDQGQVNSYGIGLTTPLGDFSDLEMRFSYDDSENFGDTYVFSLYLYSFGN